MAIVYSERLMDHFQWADHPESPLRLRTLRRKLEKEGLWTDVVEPEPATEEMVLAVHSKEHLEKLKRGGEYPLDQDTFLHDGTYALAMLSAGAAVRAVAEAAAGRPSVALTRPPGHHAGRDHMGGFCYINNVAVAVQATGLRTAIVDLDAHHCNGTEEIFYDRGDVMVVSIHEADFYWDSGYLESVGAGPGRGCNINIPVPASSGDRTYAKAMDEIVLPVLRDFAPELVAVSLGVDAHYCDQNSHLALSTQEYVSLCRSLYEFSGGRIAFILEGGYHLRATAEVVAGVVGMFSGREIKPEYGEVRREPGSGPRQVRRDREFVGTVRNI